jgi:hypothetical protein
VATIDGVIYVPGDKPDGLADWILWLDADDVPAPRPAVS